MAEGKELGKLIIRCKDEYDQKLKAFEGQAACNYRTEKHVQMKPKQSFLAAENLCNLFSNSLYSDITLNRIVKINS